MAKDLSKSSNCIKLDGIDILDKSVPEIQHDESVSNKQKSIDRVNQLYKDGDGIRAISRETGLARKTVKRYLDPNVSVVHASYGTTRESILTPFHNVIDELFEKRYTFKRIEEVIREKGYSGSASTIRMYTTRKRRLIKQTIETLDSNVEIIERNHLIKLLYKPLEKVKEISLKQLEAVIDKNPVLAKIYEIVSSFREVLFGKNPDALDSWIEKATLLNISEVNSYIKGINRDIEGVKNAIIYEYSNGLAEGSVNKIKVIKRIMYGRCNFETLRSKVLGLEMMRKIN